MNDIALALQAASFDLDPPHRQLVQQGAEEIEKVREARDDAIGRGQSPTIKLLLDRDALLEAAQEAVAALRKSDAPATRDVVSMLRKTMRGLEYPPE